MPGASVDLGNGASITFGTSGWTAQITSLAWNGVSRASVETSHLGTSAAAAGKIGSKTFMPASLTDPGSLAIEGHFNPNTNPPIEQAAETITVTFPLVSGDSTAANWQASGFMTDFAITGIVNDEKMMFSATVKLSGSVTMTDAT